MTLHRRTVLSLLAGAAAGPRIAFADTFPSRPIHLVVGFTPGAASDIIGRLFAQGAAPLVGQEIVVENKPGAGSLIAAQYVAHAAKDGYTLFLPALSTLTNVIINPSATVDIGRDFAPIALLAIGTVVLVVNPASNVHSVAELIALAKAKPGQVLYGSTGLGSLPQLAAEMFAQRAGVKLTHVPYPGSPQIAQDLLAGRITMSFTIASSVIGQIAAGQIIALATAATKRPSRAAQRADHGGSRHARLRYRPVAGFGGARRRATAGHRQNRRGGQQGDAHAANRGVTAQAGLRSA